MQVLGVLDFFVSFLKTCVKVALSFVLSTFSVDLILCLLLNRITHMILTIDVSDKIPTKILVQHIDTVSNAEATKEVVESFIVSRTHYPFASALKSQNIC